MNADGNALLSETITRLVLVPMYSAAGLGFARILVPRLSSTGIRLSAVMLLLQVLLLIVSLEYEPASQYTRWLWGLHEEWNIPATFASMQLALVGGVALTIALVTRPPGALQRGYWSAIGLVFLFSGLDEYLALHESVMDWELRYIVLGVIVVLSTVFMAAGAPSRERGWYVLMLAGLALSVVGAIVLNATPRTCDLVGFLPIDGCLQTHVWEEAFEFIGIWLVLVASLGVFASRMPGPPRRLNASLHLFPAIWILVLLLHSLSPRLEVRAAAQPAAVEFETGVSLSGYRLEGGPFQEGDSFRYWLFASASQEDYSGLGYSTHLVDQVSGDPYGHRNRWAQLQHGFWWFGPDYAPLYRQWMNFPYSRFDVPRNRALWVVVTLWRKRGDDYVSLPIIASDHQLLNERQVILGDMVLRAAATNPLTNALASFDQGFTLRSIEIPAVAQSGETLDIPVSWSSRVDSREDHVQFLHFIHEASGAHWNHDQPPLGLRLPTRLWYSGLVDSETWRFTVPTDLAPGRYAVSTGLYRRSDQVRLPVRDAAGQLLAEGRVPLGSITIEATTASEDKP